jgi:uncharacterized protein YndB with AHSA1/START domain
MSDGVDVAALVEVSPERAFEVFVDRLASWWPREYTWSQGVLEDIAIEPHEGGMCFERGPHGFRCDWGRVLTWDPPHRLVIAWQISPRREPVPDPAKASEVDVRFDADEGGATRVRLHHRHFERHGDDGARYAQMLGAPEGWPFLLDRFTAACAPGTSG